MNKIAKNYANIYQRYLKSLNKTQDSNPEVEIKEEDTSKLTFKTKYNWAIRTDIIILLLFVAFCNFAYQVMIFGAYWG